MNKTLSLIEEEDEFFTNDDGDRSSQINMLSSGGPHIPEEKV